MTQQSGTEPDHCSAGCLNKWQGINRHSRIPFTLAPGTPGGLAFFLSPLVLTDCLSLSSSVRRSILFPAPAEQ